MRNPLSFLAGAVCTAFSWAVPAQSLEIARELWDRPRTSATVLAESGVKSAVSAALGKPESKIVIHHGGAQESALYAEELRSWLAALAVDPRRVELRAGLAGDAALRIEVLP